MSVAICSPAQRSCKLICLCACRSAMSLQLGVAGWTPAPRNNGSVDDAVAEKINQGCKRYYWDDIARIGTGQGDDLENLIQPLIMDNTALKFLRACGEDQPGEPGGWFDLSNVDNGVLGIPPIVRDGPITEAYRFDVSQSSPRKLWSWQMMVYNRLSLAPAPKGKSDLPEHVEAIEKLKQATVKDGIVMVTAQHFDVKDGNRLNAWKQLERKGILRASGDWGIGNEANCPTWFVCVHLEDEVILMRPSKNGCTWKRVHRGDEAFAPRSSMLGDWK